MPVINLRTDQGSGSGGVTYVAHFPFRFHVMGYGQSTSIGVGGVPVITDSQPYDNEMLNTGIRCKELEGGSYTSFVPLVETQLESNTGETGIAAMSNFFVEKLADYGWPAHPDQGFQVLGSTGGRGGSHLYQLAQGSTFYEGMIAMVQAGYDLSLAASETYAFGVMMFTQGEADQVDNTATRAEYGAGLRQLWSAVATDVLAIDGWSESPPMLVNQLASHLHYYSLDTGAVARPEIALAQRDAASNPNVMLLSPRYIYDYVDNVHQDEESYRMMGFYGGRAFAKIMASRLGLRDAAPIAVDCLDTKWQGNVIDCKFSVPKAPLVFDTSWVTEAENMGFDLWNDDGDTLLDIIDSVAVAGPDRVTITCSEEPPAGARLTYGFGRPGATPGDTDPDSGRTAGPRGNLRDSEGDDDSYTDEAMVSRRLDNWCMIFESIKP